MQILLETNWPDAAVQIAGYLALAVVGWAFFRNL